MTSRVTRSTQDSEFQLVLPARGSPYRTAQRAYRRASREGERASDEEQEGSPQIQPPRIDEEHRLRIPGNPNQAALADSISTHSSRLSASPSSTAFSVITTGSWSNDDSDPYSDPYSDHEEGTHLDESDEDTTIRHAIPAPPPTPIPQTPSLQTPPPSPLATHDLIDIDMADILGSKPFSGEEDDEVNPQDFIKRLETIFFLKSGFDEPGKVKFLNLNLKAGSVAEEWFTGLTESQKASWATVEAAFQAKWPPKTVRLRSGAEKLALLETTILEAKDIGVKVQSGGRAEYSHIVWADKVEKLANDIPDTGNLFVDATRRRLPNALRKLITGRDLTWAQFAKTVRELRLTEIREALEDEKKNESIMKALDDIKKAQTTRQRETAQNHTRSMSTLTNTLAGMNLTTTATQRLPQVGYGAYQNQQQRVGSQPQFQAFQPQRPDHERLADVRANALPIHPDTPQGRVAYEAQITAWTTMHGTRTPTETRPYPLTPGTLPVASGECWTCGQPRHAPTPCARPAPDQERTWRRIAGSIANRVRNTASVNFVGMYNAYGGPQAPGIANISNDQAGEPTLQDYNTVVQENQALLARIHELQGKGEGSSI